MTDYSVIVIDTDNNIEIQLVHNRRIELSEIKELISNDCRAVQMVRPAGLYTSVGFKSMFQDKESGRMIVMLVDEEGKLKPHKINRVGSYLNKSGYPSDYIAGNVVFVSCEYFDEDKIDFDFAGIDMNSEINMDMYKALEGLCNMAKDGRLR